jgi:hypothetical protein
MDTIMTREDIKADFLSEALAHGKALSNGDYKGANRIHKRLQVLYKVAKKQNQIDVFSELLEENDENVRLWAATFTIEILPELAENVLINLAELSTITGLSAKTVLNLWKENKLNLL